MGYSIGSQVLMFPFSTDPSERVTLTVVGLAGPLDANEEYWINSPGHYFSIREQGDELHVPVYVLEEDFFNVLGAGYPSLVGDFTWFFFLNTDVLTSATAGKARDDLEGLETDVNRHYPRTLVFTGLKNAIDQYRQDLTLARVPLYLFISLIVLVILYFLALVVGLLARARLDEAGLMRSRGAGLMQVSGLLILGEGVITLAAMLVGPGLAWLLVRFALLETINPAGAGSEPIPVGLSLNVFVMGFIGGVLCLLVLGVSSVTRARLGMVESLRERARPPSLPLLQRYYIDLLVLAAVAFILWEIRGREGFVISELAGRAPKVDYTLLFGPVLALIGAGVIALRALPWVARAVSWAADRLAPAWVAFPLARLARDPIPHGSLAIILMMAAALGVFGAAFQSTLSLSQREQALYKAGGDFVVKGAALSDRDAGALAQSPAVSSFTPVLRENGVMHDILPKEPITMLAIDPETLPDTAWFRDDFAGKSLPQLLEALAAPSGFLAPGANVDAALGVAVPGDAEALGVWVDTSGLEQTTLFPGFNMWARMYDPQGRFHNLFLGEVTYNPGPDAGPNWTYLEVEMPEADIPPGELFRLVSLFFSRKSFSSMPPGALRLDDITAVTPEGAVVVEGIRGAGQLGAAGQRGGRRGRGGNHRGRGADGAGRPQLRLARDIRRGRPGDNHSPRPLPHPGHRRPFPGNGTADARPGGAQPAAGNHPRHDGLFPHPGPHQPHLHHTVHKGLPRLRPPHQPFQLRGRGGSIGWPSTRTWNGPKRGSRWKRCSAPTCGCWTGRTRWTRRGATHWPAADGTA